MSIKIDAKSKKVILKIENLDKSIPRNLRNGLYTVGKLLRSTASQNILKRGRKGRIYRIRGRKHTASVAGESWANLTGAARRGLMYKVQSSSELLFGNTVKRAKWLEDGTKRMAPRPAHLISIKQNNRNIIRIVSDSIRKSLV